MRKSSLKHHGIVQAESPVLRGSAKTVPLQKIRSQKIKKVIDELIAAVGSRDDAVAIAAPQLGYPLRIFVISGKVFEDENASPESGFASRNFVFINPVITRLSRRKEVVEEGCLSVDGKYGMVKRAQKATVRALDEHGNPFEWGGSGLLAQIFQHEIDHLDGILFTDSATDVRDVPAERLSSLAR